MTSIPIYKLKGEIKLKFSVSVPPVSRENQDGP